MKLEQAFNAGVGMVSESLKPVKESLVSMLQLPLEDGEVDKGASADTEHASVHEPSTPQLKHGAPFMDDGDCLQEQTNCSTEKESMEQDGESKSVETTFDNSTAETLPGEKTDFQLVKDGLIKKEDNSGENNSKSEGGISPLVQSKDDSHGSHDCANNMVKLCGVQNSTRKANQKKLKVIFSPVLGDNLLEHDVIILFLCCFR